tara:strand:- start:57 stop:239 length:183 start_codon:yes stop_codon:yes gene_type:complete
MTNEKTYLINEIKEDLKIKIDLLEAIKNGYNNKEVIQNLEDVIDDLILYSRLQITNILKA